MIEMERAEAVRKALSELPGRVQDCLRARVVDGLKNSEIGERLGISKSTVKYHLGAVFEKLGAHTRAEAVAMGLRKAP